MLTEKIGGMMERMMVAGTCNSRSIQIAHFCCIQPHLICDDFSGVTITEIVLSATVIQIVVHCIQTFLAMMVIYWWFDNPLEGSIITLSLLMLLTGISGMFFGMCVKEFGKTCRIIECYKTIDTFRVRGSRIEYGHDAVFVHRDWH